METEHDRCCSLKHWQQFHHPNILHNSARAKTLSPCYPHYSRSTKSTRTCWHNIHSHTFKQQLLTLPYLPSLEVRLSQPQECLSKFPARRRRGINPHTPTSDPRVCLNDLFVWLSSSVSRTNTSLLQEFSRTPLFQVKVVKARTLPRTTHNTVRHHRRHLIHKKRRNSQFKTLCKMPVTDVHLQPRDDPPPVDVTRVLQDSQLARKTMVTKRCDSSGMKPIYTLPSKIVAAG